MDDLEHADEAGRRAAAQLTADVARRVDVDAALQQVRSAGAWVSPLTTDASRRRTRAIRIASVAAVLAAAIAGGVVLTLERGRRDGGPADVPTLPVTVSLAPDPTSEPATVPQVPTTAASPSTSDGSAIAPLAIGGSVMLGATDQLEAGGFLVDTDVSQQAAEVIAALEVHLGAGEVGDVVVIQIGTNGAVTDEQFEQVLALLPPSVAPHVVLLTVFAGDRTWIAPNNELIRLLPTRHPNVTVADWAAAAPTISLCPDQVHLTCHGDEPKQAYANLVFDAIGRPDLRESVGSTTATTTTATATAPATTTTDAPAAGPSIDVMASFVTAPTDPTVSLAAVPRLFPTAPVPTGDVPTRLEGDTASSYAPVHIQSWSTTGADPMLLEITTSPGIPMGDQIRGQEVEVAPWDRAVLADSANDTSILFVADPSGSVRIFGRRLSADDVFTIARSMQPRDGGGWTITALPADLVERSAGWTGNYTGRFVSWGPGHAELHVRAGDPYAFSVHVLDLESVDIADIGGVDAVVFGVSGGRVEVVWSPSPGIVASFGYVGTAADTLAIARSVAPVDESTWLAIAPHTDDGCNSMFC